MTTTTTTRPVAVDINGADGGPDLVEEGARLAGTPVTLFGGAEITNDEDPALAVRSREDASVVRAAKAVGAGEADALVSAGATGALLAASLFHVKRIRGVHRPAIAALVPLPGKPVLLLDAGANVDVRPEHLVQFAYMGAAFMQAVQGVERPRVGLLSIGEEPKKGTADVVAAHEQLAAGTLDFAGNVEGTDLAAGAVDVVVTDGFTGNVALKLMEGTARTVAGAVRDAIRGGRVERRRPADPGPPGRAQRAARPKHDGRRDPARRAPPGRGRAREIDRRGHRERGPAGAPRGRRGMVERTAAALAEAGVLRSAPAASFAPSHD